VSTALPASGLPPLSPRGRRKVVVAVVVYALAIGFGVALFTGSLPGLGGHITSNVLLDGREYATSAYFLPFPMLGTNSTPARAVVFDNVTFWIWTTGWYDPHGSFVHGNGTAVGGSTYSFLLGGMANNASRPMLFVAPDQTFAVDWGGGAFLQLLVELTPS